MNDGLREIALDELPAFSPWPARLLGLAAARDEPRTPERVMREYDRDKYGPLLDAVKRDPALTADDVRRLELGSPDAPVAMSIGDRLFAAPAAEALRRTTEALVERVGSRLGAARSIVDLGCGYGYQLARLGDAHPRPQLRGGELSPRAVRLARHLGMAVDRFDFAGGTCAPLEQAAAPAVVVLSYTVNQLPSAAVAVELLAAHRDRIDRVVCFDAERRAQDDGLLGLLRRRYMELNRYSWDLLDVLDARPDVRVEAFEPNVIGPNALLPASLVAWRFT